MLKILITTNYVIECADGETRKFKAETWMDYNHDDKLPGIFDIHTEKMGAIERNILKINE